MIEENSELLYADFIKFIGQILDEGVYLSKGSIGLKDLNNLKPSDIKSLELRRNMSVSASASEDYVSYCNVDDLKDSNGLEPVSFQEVLSKYYEDISLKDYLELKKSILKFHDYEEQGYYGSFSVEIESSVNLHDLFLYLQSKNKLTPKQDEAFVLQKDTKKKAKAKP